MRGIINVEFVISIMVFLSIMSFVALMVINSLPMLRYESIGNDMRSRAYQLSNILFFNLSAGEPYVLDTTKIEAMNTMCDDYENFRNLFSEYLMVEIKLLDGTELLSCRPSLKTLVKPEFTLKRFATVDERIVIMDVNIIR